MPHETRENVKLELMCCFAVATPVNGGKLGRLAFYSRLGIPPVCM